jgi:SAM-dependent methyltransferase
MSFYRRVLGHPFVYNHLRPLVVGGIDLSGVYDRVQPNEKSVILDIGCGTGDALRYLKCFRRYVGMDPDDVAIRFAREKYAAPNIDFHGKRCTSDDVRSLEPTHVVMAGLLHHLTDEEALALLEVVTDSPALDRVITQDIVFLRGELVNNLLARLDRGRYCRDPDGYERLVERSRLQRVESAIVRSHPTRGLAKYFVMTLKTRPSGSS